MFKSVSLCSQQVMLWWQRISTDDYSTCTMGSAVPVWCYSFIYPLYLNNTTWQIQSQVSSSEYTRSQLRLNSTFWHRVVTISPVKMQICLSYYCLQSRATIFAVGTIVREHRSAIVFIEKVLQLILEVWQEFLGMFFFF